MVTTAISSMRCMRGWDIRHSNDQGCRCLSRFGRQPFFPEHLMPQFKPSADKALSWALLSLMLSTSPLLNAAPLRHGVPALWMVRPGPGISTPGITTHIPQSAAPLAKRRSQSLRATSFSDRAATVQPRNRKQQNEKTTFPADADSLGQPAR